MKKVLIAIVLSSGVLLSACNTVEGAGKDVSSVGRTVAHTADSAK